MTTQNLVNNDMEVWFSTYGTITVERILKQFGFSVDSNLIQSIIHTPENIYYQFLRVPLSNILNEIIINQAEDYRGYLQKLYIDYLLSGAGNEVDAPPQGEDLRASLEELRLEIIAIGNDFDVEIFNNNSFIVKSQNELLSIARKNLVDIDDLSSDVKIKIIAKIDNLDEESLVLREKMSLYRNRFSNFIPKVVDMLSTLPNYNLDLDKLNQHKASIEFDPKIGTEVDRE